VTVSGQVRFAGKYLLHKNEKLSSLIERAGGYLDNAYLRGSRFTRESVRMMQQKSIEEMALRMERDLLIGGTEQLAKSLSAEEFQAKRSELDQKKKLVETIRNVKSIGRMSVKIEQLDVLKGSYYDIALEDGDQLMIPEKNSAVGVVGSVMGQGTHVFLEGEDYLSYINRSGGFSEYADESKIFVLKVDGSAVKAKNSVFSWNSSTEKLEIEPGDVIVVPEKVERIAWLREIRDITQILMNTAVAAGVVIKLF
jgi:polysaccharide biosynthesis/export protein